MRKRDGREVPYDKRKVEHAVRAALEAVGEPDPTFAGEVADVVELALLDRGAAAHGDALGAGGPAGAGGPEDGAPRVLDVVPGIEEIQDLVERALVELGRAAVAKAYILYRDRRSRARSALAADRVGEAASSDAAAAGAGVGADRALRVRVRETAGTTPWEKGRVVAALMEEAELPRDTAQEVAARVERRVLHSGLRTVTSGLVRELVSGELVELGLDAALLRQAPVGVPRHDLRRMLREPARRPWEASDLADRQPEALAAARASVARVEGEVLARYAADDVLAPGSVELHRAGDLDVVDLERPHRPLAVSLPVELLLEGEPGPDAPFRVLGAVGDLARGVGRSVVLEQPGALFAPLLRSSRDRGAAQLPGFLAALGAISRASGCAVGLASPGPRHAALAARLVEALDTLAADPFAPTLYLAGDELDALTGSGRDDALERLLARGRLLPTFGDEGRSLAGPGCQRLRKERGALAASGAVALNLPRLARRAGPWREEVFLSSLVDLVRCAVEIGSSLHAFQSALPSFLPPRLAARPSFALAPVGLREALRVLGDGTVDPERGARILGVIAEAGRRFQAPGSPRVITTPFFGDGARVRLAWLDSRERLADGGQRWLFADAELRREGGSAPGGAYAEGYALAPVRGLLPGQAEAELLKTLVVGALPLARGVASLSTVDPESPRPHLAAWRRFHDLVRARRAGADDLLFPSPRRASSGAPFAQESA
ncbi:MAG: ATP cone domain-containing protein [Planctomycetota bacterium]